MSRLLLPGQLPEGEEAGRKDGHMAILIKNGTLITMNQEREILKGDLLIENDRIQSIGKLNPAREDEVIDAEGQLLLPGLIQTHVHLCQTLFRGMANDLELLDWLNLRIWPLEAAHDEESLYHSALLGIAELLQGGTTTIVDMGTVRHTDAAFHAARESGIRYIGGKCMMDHGENNAGLLAEEIDQSVQESLDLYRRWHETAQGRIRYAFCPRFVPSCSETLLREVAALSSELQAYVHTHASENRSECQLVEEERGMRNIVYLDELGLCHERTILAHCIHVDREEMGILKERGVHVAHCPSCNMKLSSGIAPVVDYLQQGITVGLGADGAPANDNLSMFQEMRMAALIQKPLHGPTSMPARQIVEMATLNGARTIGLQDEIGSLEVGKKADLIILNPNQYHSCPHLYSDPYGMVVYQLSAGDVRLTMVDGKILFRDGQLLMMEDGLASRAEKSLQRVVAGAGIAL